jgi:hypothetical protein
MTQRKQLKARVRARMAQTGESYVTAFRHVAGTSVPGGSIVDQPAGEMTYAVDRGYALRGGLHPESANVQHVLAHHGIAAVNGSTERPISEALVFGISGGIGAGYILWEFKQHGAATLVMAFHNSWQYPDRWHEKTLDRLGVRYIAEHQGGITGASRRLTELLEAGRPCIIRPDRYHLGYWRLPEYMDGHGGPDIVAYAVDDDGVWLDDRNVSPLVVSHATLGAARARVGSYRNSLYAIDSGSGPIPIDRLREAVHAGLYDTVRHLSDASASFSLPAWRKWARLLTDRRNAKAWPNVFADGENGLAGALISVWEHVMPAGGFGGHLRDLYAEFLDEAAELLENPRLGDVAHAFRGAASAWHDVADAAIPREVSGFERLRELTVAVRQAVADPASVDAGEADAAAAELWALRGELDRDFPLGDDERDELFAGISARVDVVFAREQAAVASLAAALTDSRR